MIAESPTRIAVHRDEERPFGPRAWHLRVEAGGSVEDVSTQGEWVALAMTSTSTGSYESSSETCVGRGRNARQRSSRLDPSVWDLRRQARQFSYVAWRKTVY
jgi:hypothetical protein